MNELEKLQTWFSLDESRAILSQKLESKLSLSGLINLILNADLKVSWLFSRQVVKQVEPTGALLNDGSGRSELNRKPNTLYKRKTISGPYLIDMVHSDYFQSFLLSLALLNMPRNGIAITPAPSVDNRHEALTNRRPIRY